MGQIDRARLKDVLLQSPAWARVALTVRDERIRLKGADALADAIAEKLEQPAIECDRNQLSLPI